MEQERVFPGRAALRSYARFDRRGQDWSGDDSRARAFGMPVVAWSRSLTPEHAASLGIETESNTAGSRSSR